MNKRHLRAAFYMRFSTDKQRAESIDDQRRVCARVVERERFSHDAAHEYGDPAKSGGTHQRPDYQRMLTDARAGKFDVIIAEDSSRLWRNMAEQAPRIAELRDLGVHIMTASGLDSRHPSFAMSIGVMGIIAEQGRMEAAYRTRRGLEGRVLAKSKNGAGGRAYGYIPGSRSASGEREINPAEAAIVVQIYEWRAEGKSGLWIAQKLNEMGVPSPGAAWSRTNDGPHRKAQDGGWRPSAIIGDRVRGTGILNNPLYVGRVVWGRTEWKRGAADSAVRKVSLQDRDTWQGYELPELRIVSPDLWDKVQAIQGARSAQGAAIAAALKRDGRTRGKIPALWLSSILTCDVCGSHFVQYGKRNYCCPTARVGKCKNTMFFRVDAAEQQVIETLTAKLASADAVDHAVRYAADYWARTYGAKAAPADTSPELAQLDAQVESLRAMMKAGTLAPTAAQAALQALQADRTRILNDGRAPARSGRSFDVAKFRRRYQLAVERALTMLQDRRNVALARDGLRQMILGGKIRLRPAGDRLAGAFELDGLSQLVVLEGRNNNGSGGRI